MSEVNLGDWQDFDRTNAQHVIRWRIEGKIREFEIVREVPFPTMAKVIKDATFEDHLEQLLFDGKNYYRHAGGGRGFYWTQLLQEVK